MNPKYDWYSTLFSIWVRCKFNCNLWIQTGARISHQVHLLAPRVCLIDFILSQLKTSIEYICSRESVVPVSTWICRVNYVAKGSSEGPIKFELWFVFCAACLVQIWINEGFHWINLEKVLRYWMVRVWKYFRG